MGNITEFWFSKHYRVVVVREEDGSFLASVDIYRRGWFFSDYDEICLESGRACLLYKVITVEQLAKNAKVERIVVTGVRVGDTLETINVRWIGKGEVDEDTAKSLFEESWKIIKCEPPSIGVWRFKCVE